MPFLEARLALVGRFRSYFELPLLAVSVVFRVTGSRSLSPRLIGRLTLGRRPASRQKGPVFAGPSFPEEYPKRASMTLPDLMSAVVAFWPHGYRKSDTFSLDCVHTLCGRRERRRLAAESGQTIYFAIAIGYMIYGVGSEEHDVM
jgi:hypothetical protein